MMLLNSQRPETEQFRADGIEAEKRDALGSSSQPFVRADRYAAKQAAFVAHVVVFDVEEMPAVLRVIGKDEKRVRMLTEQARDDRSLAAEREFFRSEPG